MPPRTSAPNGRGSGRITSAKCASTSASIPCGLPEQIAFRSSTWFQGDAARAAEIASISPHIAFRSPEGQDAKSAENDWLRAGKRAMCVSIF